MQETGRFATNMHNATALGLSRFRRNEGNMITMNSLDLNGTWKMRWSDGQRGKFEHADGSEVDTRPYIDAVVPGEIHLDLQRAGLIPDPNVGTGSLAARWVEESFWSYRREFDAPADALTARAWLSFAGLDLVAVIRLNGETIGSHNNSFTPSRIDVSGKLRKGRNVLTVHIEGGLFSVSDKQGEGFYHSPDQKLHKRHWLRKPQSEFSWDWAPRLVNVGITGAVALEWTDAPVRVESFVPLATLSDDLATGSLRARLFVEGLDGVATHGKLNVSVPELGLTAIADVSLLQGLHPVEVTLPVTNPELWWPVGQGDPKLYEVRAELTIKGQMISALSARVGFRNVRINQDIHPDQGRYFIIEVNGRPIFAKGANFVPADLIVPAIDRTRYEVLVDLALEANFNILRVWGGGLYEHDAFYRICDEKGVLVWQEFVYACGRYPMQDAEFYSNAKAEAVYQVRRLAEHASLIIWCGNNEMEWGAWEWGYDEKGEILPDYAFFHLTLPRILAEDDPTRYYQPSSPYSLDMNWPNANETGDQHPWSVGITGYDWHDYRKMTCRFPNEGGTLGSNSLPTTLACLPEGQRYVGSFAWQHHDNTIAELYLPGIMWDQVNHFIGKDVNAMTIEEFVYWAGLLQGEALREYADNFRRRMFDSASAIFWMYNDCWPTTRSWTIVDYYLRRTPAFCPVKRSFAPVSVVVVEDGDEIVAYGVNDHASKIKGELRYGVLALAGGYPIDRRVSVRLAGNASTELARFSTSEWLAIDGERVWSVAFAELLETGAATSLIARNRYFPHPFKAMTWPAANVSVRLEHGKAVFNSDAFAWGVCLDLDGERSLADNFFDVWPGVEYTIPWHFDIPPVVLHTGNLSQ